MSGQEESQARFQILTKIVVVQSLSQKERPSNYSPTAPGERVTAARCPRLSCGIATSHPSITWPGHYYHAGDDLLVIRNMMLWAIMFIPDLLTYPGDKFKRLALGVAGALDHRTVVQE